MKFPLIHKRVYLLAVLFDKRQICVIYPFTVATLIAQKFTQLN
jgi:hypothetical protein